MTCPNCGAADAHFVPPSLGEAGFYICKRATTYAAIPEPSMAPCNTCGRPGPGGEPCGRCNARALHALRVAINALTYCPYCGQGHAMHTTDCRLRPLLETTP